LSVEESLKLLALCLRLPNQVGVIKDLGLWLLEVIVNRRCFFFILDDSFWYENILKLLSMLLNLIYHCLNLLGSKLNWKFILAKTHLSQRS
jgi:hypothetical protein